MALSQEPILSRVDRLDNIMRQLEELRGCNRLSPKSSSASTPSSESQLSSVDFSPRSIQEKHCRPIACVLMETQVKGTLLDRLAHVEERLLKLCLQLESELVAEKKGEENTETQAHNKSKKKKKGLKGLVNKMVKASN